MALMLTEVESMISFSTTSNNKELQYNQSMENNNYINYAYLSGVLGAKLKWIALEFERQGLLKSDDREKALEIAFKAIADAEAAERDYTKNIIAKRNYTQG